MNSRTPTEEALLRQGVNLERLTLALNVVGIVVLGFAAVAARSVALAGFGLDSLVEIGASTVVLWELAGTGDQRRHRALGLIGWAFIALAVYVAVQSAVVLVTGYRPRASLLGIGWTARARWSVKGAEAVLKVRAVRCNGDFDDYWRFHLDQERRRVHESRYANEVIPLAA